MKKVCVIGAGSSGLAALKALLEEDFDAICYEVSDHVGGLWKYREDDVEGLACVMKGTYMNTSKEMSAYSDFPPPDDFPNYMPHKFVHKYLSSYADHFGLRDRVKFRHRVLKVTPNSDYDETGRWIVIANDESKNVSVEAVFDAVMVCAGHHAYPHTPELPGMDKYKGKTMHSHSYKRPEPFEGCKALVIGLGNSGADIAVELSHVAEKVYLSSRHGSWIHNRLGKYGKPYDIEFYRRKDMLLKGLSSFKSIFDKAEAQLNYKVDHEFYNLKPNRRIYNQYTIINDELAVRLLNGTVKLKKDVSNLTENGVIFKDDNDTVHEVDVIVLATGYELKYPFLSKDVVDFEKDPLEVYHFVFPANLKHPSTLSFVGMIDPEGSVFTVSEMQSRWIVQVLKGKVRLPNKERMSHTIRKTGELLRHWSYEGNRHKTRIFWYFYMEKLADYIGVRPNLRALFFSDPKLFWVCFTGPMMSYQYRITGPHAWLGARDALISYEKRVNKPLMLNSGNSTNNVPLPKSNGKSVFKVAFTFFLTFGVVAAYAMKNTKILYCN